MTQPRYVAFSFDDGTPINEAVDRVIELRSFKEGRLKIADASRDQSSVLGAGEDVIVSIVLEIEEYSDEVAEDLSTIIDAMRRVEEKVAARFQVDWRNEPPSIRNPGILSRFAKITGSLRTKK